MRVTVFGYLSHDRNTINGITQEMVGGKGLYATAALVRCGIETDLVTWFPDSDLDLLRSLGEYPCRVHVIQTTGSTQTSNTHTGDNTITTMRSEQRPIMVSDISEEIRAALIGSDVVLLMPEFKERIPLETIRYLTGTLGVTLRVDIGKYLRAIEPDGTQISRYPISSLADYLHYFGSVFFSAEDIQSELDAGESLLSVARDVADLGPAEVIITQGSQGVSIFDRTSNELVEIPAFPVRQTVDPTGAGDTFIGAYLARHLQSDNPTEAGRFAAVAASLKLAYSGPLKENTEEIEKLLQEHITE